MKPEQRGKSSLKIKFSLIFFLFSFCFPIYLKAESLNNNQSIPFKDITSLDSFLDVVDELKSNCKRFGNNCDNYEDPRLIYDFISSTVSNKESIESKYLKRLLDLYTNSEDFVNLCIPFEDKIEDYPRNACMKRNIKEIEKMIERKKNCSYSDMDEIERIVFETSRLISAFKEQITLHVDFDNKELKSLKFLDKYIDNNDKKIDVLFKEFLEQSKETATLEWIQDWIVKICQTSDKDESFVLSKIQNIRDAVNNKKNCINSDIDGLVFKSYIAGIRFFETEQEYEYEFHKKEPDLRFYINKIGSSKKIALEFMDKIIRGDKWELHKWAWSSCLEFEDINEFKNAFINITNEANDKRDKYLERKSIKYRENGTYDKWDKKKEAINKKLQEEKDKKIKEMEEEENKKQEKEKRIRAELEKQEEELEMLRINKLYDKEKQKILKGDTK